MECNKEEALRAKNLAEEKMKACDYVGAQKFITKAQRLYPDLDNILQMITICEVHLSANQKISGLDNWYGILQVQPFSDVETIRKQYRKFALLLHPDKNKFSGAEAAFKLVGEGYRLLSDRIKRSQYDVRYRSHSMLATRNLNANSGRHCAAANNVAGNIRSVHTFWTCCKNCGHRYKYLKCYVDTVMHCSTCKKSYIACDIGDEKVPPSSSAIGKKEFQDQGVKKNNISGQTASIRSESGSSATEMDKKNGTVNGKLNKTNQQNQEKGCGNRKPKKGNAECENPQKCERCTNISALKKNQAAKKRRKSVRESTKNSEVDSSAVTGAKTDTNELNKSSSSRKKPQVSSVERESDGDFVSPPTKRTKTDCEFESDLNTKQTTEDNKSPEVADSGVSPASSHAYKEKSKNRVTSENEDILTAENKESEGRDGNEEDAVFSSKTDKVENGFKGDKNRNTIHIADPESNVFEDERKTENFAVNQVWSVRDSRDGGMPRKYVRVKKVWKGKFKLRVTYLEPVQNKKNDENIPVACGKFKNGKSVEVEDRSIFSGQMRHFFNNKIDIIYPRKGEVWALFRDWNEEWNCSLENHKVPYQYDIVEVVSDFNDEVGIGVAYLGKVKGSVSRFHREAQRGVCQIQFTPKDILRFSHKVPAVKMTGKEKECDSFELDRDALPEDIRQADAVDMVMDSEILRGKADGPYPEAPKLEVKTKPVPKTAPSSRKRQKSDVDNGICSNHAEAKGLPSRNHNVSPCQVDEMNIPNKSRKSCEAADVVNLRKSPRLQTIPSQQRDEKKTAKQCNKMDTPKRFVTDSLEIRKSPNGIHQPAESQEGESSKKQRCNDELPSSSKQNDLPTQLDGSANESPETTHVSSSCKTPRRNAFESQKGESSKKQRRNGELPSSSKQNDLPTQLDGSANESPETTHVSSCKTPRRNAFDFKNQKSEDKFRVNQVWAIYSGEKKLPVEYVQIKKIEKKPNFVIRANQMEPYPPSTEPVTRQLSCGDFKLKMGKPNILPLDSFSHLVEPVHRTKSIIKVYPRKDEIWALYKTCDSTKEEYDVVEVVEEYGDDQVAKAVALTANGSNSLYIVQKKHGSNLGFIHIPKAEISRFSHRIPAVRHEKKTTRLVEGRYWELDPIAIPNHTIVLE